MKKIVYTLMLASFVFLSCKKEAESDKSNIENEKPISTQCYLAVYENDTIDLEINTLKDQKVSGDMVMSFLNMPKKIGKIKGEFRGDTLYADYSFIQGANTERMFKNPIAILKRRDSLILGNGKIENYMGASYFKKGEPIDFEKVKFKFTSVECVDKK